MTTLQDFWDELFEKDPDAAREYERLKPLFGVMKDVVLLRAALGLTQAQLAERMGRQQPSIGRFEAGNTNPTLGFLQDIAEALGARLVVRIEPIDSAAEALVDKTRREKKAPSSSRKRRSGAAA